MGAWPPFKPEVLSEDENSIITRDPRGIVLKNLKKSCSMPDFIDYPVHNRKEWEKYKDERLQPNAGGRFLKPGCAWNLWNDVPWTPATAQEATAPVAEQASREKRPVAVGTFPWGVFGTARDMMGAEELLITFYTDPALVHDIMDTFTDLWVSLYEQVAKYVQIDHVHIWEDMSGKQGSLISPAMIEEFMMPNYRKIHEFVKSHKVALTSVDSDGLVDELIPVMMRNGMNVMFPFEVQAGCDIEKYRRLYPTLGIWGGLNKHALAVDRSAIDVELAKAQRMLKHGRYVPCLDHLVPVDVSWDAWVYYNKRLKEIMGVG
jgi:uroporphyrinogen decarboxylase